MRYYHKVAVFCLSALPACLEPLPTDSSELAYDDELGFTEQAITLTPEQQAIDAVLKDPDIVVSNDPPFATDHLSTDYSTKWDGQKYLLCQSDKYGAKASAIDIVALDPNVGVLYPGALVHGIDANTGTLTPVLLPRSGGKVALDDKVFMTGATATKSAVIDEFAPDKVSDTISSILQSNQVNTASAASLVIEEAKSFEQAMLKIGVDVNKAKFSIKGDFQSESWSNKTNLVVKFTQVYYTAYPVLPYSAQVWAPDVTADDVSQVTAANDPILYVSGVSYGRTLIMRVQSDASYSDVKAALNVAYQGTVNASVQLSAEQKTLLSNSKLEVYTLGGSSESGVKVLAGPTELQSYLASGATWSPSSPGVPISYTLRALRSGKAFAAKYTSDFTIPSCSAGKQTDKLAFTLTRANINECGDAAPGMGELQYQFDLYVEGPNGQSNPVGSLGSGGLIEDVKDGAKFELNWRPGELEVLRTQKLRLRVKVWDQNCHKKWPWSRCSWEDDDKVEKDVNFQWDSSSRSWTVDQNLSFSSDQLAFTLDAGVERRNPCAPTETWDEQKDLCIPPAINPSNASLRIGLQPPVATSMTASALSTYPGYSADNVIDGDRSTALGEDYSWANSSSVYPQWLKVDFGGVKGVQDVDVYTTASYPIRDYDIEVLSGSTWLPFATVRGNTAEKVTSHVTTPLRGSAIRVLGFRGPLFQPQHVRVNELVVR